MKGITAPGLKFKEVGMGALKYPEFILVVDII